MNNEKNQPYQNDELLIGRNPVAEALSAGRSIIKVMVAKGTQSGAAVEITAKAKKAGIPVQEVERKKLDFMTGGADLIFGERMGLQGCLFCVLRHKDTIYRKSKTPLKRKKPALKAGF